jgi:hypothetical protein
MEAANVLRDHLRRICVEQPDAAHFIIGHSHGGNVITYALADPTLAQGVRGVICLATPHIRAEPRDIDATLNVFRLLVLGGAAFIANIVSNLVGMLFFLAIAFFGTRGLGVADARALVALLLVVQVLFAISLTFWINAGFQRRFADGPEHRLRKKQEAIVERLQPPFVAHPPYFCVRTGFDEASVWLRTVHAIAAVPFWLWRPNLLVAACAVMYGLFGCYYAVFTLQQIYNLLFGDGLDPTFGFGAFTFFIVVLALVANLLAACMYAVMFVLPQMVRSRIYGFGKEGLYDNVLADVRPAREPDASDVAHLNRPVSRIVIGRGPKSWRPTFRLGHCAIYDDEAVIRAIADWIGDLVVSPRCGEPLTRRRLEARPLGL